MKEKIRKAMSRGASSLHKQSVCLNKLHAMLIDKKIQMHRVALCRFSRARGGSNGFKKQRVANCKQQLFINFLASLQRLQ